MSEINPEREIIPDDSDIITVTIDPGKAQPPFTLRYTLPAVANLFAEAYRVLSEHVRPAPAKNRNDKQGYTTLFFFPNTNKTNIYFRQIFARKVENFKVEFDMEAFFTKICTNFYTKYK